MNVQVKTQRRGAPSGHAAPRRVLVVDDDRDFAAGLAEYLGLNGYEAETANDAALALDRAEVIRPGVALVDIKLGRTSGLDLVARLKERRPETLCVMITAHATVDTAIEAVKQGAYDYLRKPLVEGDVLLALERGFNKLDLECEKAAAEAALMDSEARFRDFTEAASDWVWEMDEDFRFTYMSPNVERVVDVPAEWHYGKTGEDILADDYDRDGWAEHLRTLSEHKPFRDFTFLRGGEGVEPKWLCTSGKPIFDETGAFKGYRGTGADITVRVEAERHAAEAHARLLDAVESISEGFVLYDADERLVLCNSTYREMYPKIADLLVPGGALEDIVKSTMEREQILDVGDSDAWIRARLEQYRTARGTSEQHLPGGRRVLAGERKTREGGTVGIRTDITALKQAESEVREREARIGGVLDNIADGVFTIDEAGAIESMNPAAERMFGYEPGELVGRAVTNLMPAPHRRRHPGYLRDYLASGDGKILGKGPRELEARRKDGTTFPISLAVSEMWLGDRRFFIGAIRDITEQKRAEEALRASEAQMRLITDALPVLIGYIDTDARFRFVNAACEAWYARPRAEILGRHVRDILGETGYGHIRPHLDNLSDGVPKTMEREMSFPDGSTRHVRVTGVPHIGPDGRAEGYVMLGADVSEAKRAEQALRESESRFRAITETSPVSIIITRISDGAFLFCNDQFTKLVKLPAEEVLRRNATEFYLDPKDRERVVAAMRDGRARNIEMRFRNAEDEVAWVMFSSQMMELEGESVVLSAIMDISAQKRVEAELREERERLESIAANIPGIVFQRVRDADGGVSYPYVSEGMPLIHGLEPETVMADSSVLADMMHPEDKERFLAAIDDSAERLEPMRVEARYIGPDGGVMWVDSASRPHRLEDGAIVWDGIAVDITAQKEAEAALRRSEANLAAAQRIAGLGSWEWDIEADEIRCTDQAFRIYGMEPTDAPLSSLTFFERAHPDDRAAIRAASRRALKGDMPYEHYHRMLLPDGDERIVMYLAEVTERQGGRATKMTGLVQDVTESKRSEEELRRQAQIIEQIHDSIAIADLDGNVLAWNKGSERLFGVPAKKALGRHIGFIYPAGREGFLTERGLESIIREGVRETGVRVRRATGEEFIADMSLSVLRNADGSPYGVIGYTQDITERVKAEEGLRESESRAAEAHALLVDAIESSPDGIAIYDANDKLAMFNDKFRTGVLSGLADLIVPGVGYEDLLRAAVGRGLVDIPDGDVDGYLRARVDHHRGGEGSVEVKLVGNRWMLSRERRMAGGGIVGTRRDITQMKRAEQALRESEEQLRLITDSLPVLIGYMDAEERYRFLNKPAEKWHRRPAEELIGKTLKEVLPREMYDLNRPRFEKVLSGELVQFEDEVAFPDGAVRQLQGTYIPHFGEGGKVVGFFTLGENVTRQRAMEAQLRQAQKMEAVGQLTGGVAHDFNNLLTIVLGNLELLGEDIEEKPEQMALLAPARDAALRGADLTQRLLAFSRKQTLQPKTVELNRLVLGMVDMLRRTLGENIEIRTVTAGRPWQTRVDPGQVENAILNLAINARDAMPGGGSLAVETANAVIDEAAAAKHADARPGKYVALSITDTGIGMKPEILEHALEPFFTTKDIGKGTGLGLSMIYGFVRQSGGHVRIASEEGRGTTVTLYIPKAPAPRKKAPDSGRAGRQKAPTGDETILLVEDDPPVRNLAVKILRGLGYSVLEAATGKAALEILDAAPGIDLLLTDVMLPEGMSGWDVAEEALRRRTDIKVLYVSGHADAVLAPHGGLPEGRSLLKKPFRKLDLARTVRKVLDEGRNEP